MVGDFCWVDGVAEVVVFSNLRVDARVVAAMEVAFGNGGVALLSNVPVNKIGAPVVAVTLGDDEVFEDRADGSSESDITPDLVGAGSDSCEDEDDDSCAVESSNGADMGASGRRGKRAEDVDFHEVFGSPPKDRSCAALAEPIGGGGKGAEAGLFLAPFARASVYFRRLSSISSVSVVMVLLELNATGGLCTVVASTGLGGRGGICKAARFRPCWCLAICCSLYLRIAFSISCLTVVMTTSGPGDFGGI